MAAQQSRFFGHSSRAIYIGHLLDKADELLPATARFDVVMNSAHASAETVQ